MIASAITARTSWLTSACGVGFVLYAAASSYLFQGDHLNASILLASLVFAFWLGYFLPFLSRYIWIAFCLYLCYNLFLHWRDDAWGVYGNPNMLGCALALGLASTLAYRLWLFVPPLAVGLWLTQSRGAILGASAAGFIWLWKKDWFVALLSAVAAACTLYWVGVGRDASMWQRLGIWQDTLNHLTFFGSGWGSFYEAYWAFPIKTNVGIARTPHAYNDFLELMFELGIGALLLWVFVINIFFGSQSRDKLMVSCYFFLALTYFPLWVEPVGQLVALSLGHLASERDFYGVRTE